MDDDNQSKFSVARMVFWPPDLSPLLYLHRNDYLSRRRFKSAAVYGWRFKSLASINLIGGLELRPSLGLFIRQSSKFNAKRFQHREGNKSVLRYMYYTGIS
jgi:hypothetical protein